VGPEDWLRACEGTAWAFSNDGNPIASPKANRAQAQRYSESLFESLDDINIRFELPQLLSEAAEKFSTLSKWMRESSHTVLNLVYRTIDK
jgi:hypothetical protein